MGDDSVWKSLDEELALVLEGILKVSFEKKLGMFERTGYNLCSLRFGVEEGKAKVRLQQANRREAAKGQLRSELRRLKQRLKVSRLHERDCLLALIDDIRKRIMTISRAEYVLKKRKEKRVKRERFMKNPYNFAKSCSNRARVAL